MLTEFSSCTSFLCLGVSGVWGMSCGTFSEKEKREYRKASGSNAQHALNALFFFCGL